MGKWRFFGRNPSARFKIFGKDRFGGRCCVRRGDTEVVDEGRKIDLARRDSRVGFEIDCELVPVSGGNNPCKYSECFASVIGFGHLSILDDCAGFTIKSRRA